MEAASIPDSGLRVATRALFGRVSREPAPLLRQVFSPMERSRAEFADFAQPVEIQDP